MQKNKTRQLTYAAACSAIAIVSMISARVLPLTFTVLLICCVAYFIALNYSFIYGLITIASTTVISFLLLGVSITPLLNAFIFAPYAVFAYFLRNSGLNLRLKIIRIILVLCVFYVLFLTMYLIFYSIVRDFFSAISQNLSGKLTLLLVLTPFFLACAYAFDQLFLLVVSYTDKRLHFLKKKKDDGTQKTEKDVDTSHTDDNDNNKGA